MSLPVLWCGSCQDWRVPLIEDGTCGWCGRSCWHGYKPEPAWPADAEDINYVAPRPVPTPDLLGEILSEVAAESGVPIEDILDHTRDPYVCEVRKRAMRQARETGASYPVIGRAFNRDHSTVIAAVRGRA